MSTIRPFEEIAKSMDAWKQITSFSDIVAQYRKQYAKKIEDDIIIINQGIDEALSSGGTIKCTVQLHYEPWMACFVVIYDFVMNGYFMIVHPLDECVVLDMILNGPNPETKAYRPTSCFYFDTVLSKEVKEERLTSLYREMQERKPLVKAYPLSP